MFAILSYARARCFSFVSRASMTGMNDFKRNFIGVEELHQHLVADIHLIVSSSYVTFIDTFVIDTRQFIFGFLFNVIKCSRMSCKKIPSDAYNCIQE